MAGIMEKIGDTLHIGGGDKKKEEHKGGGEYKKDEHKKEGEHKEGIVEKIKDKIHGEESSGDHKEKKGKDGHEKKKGKDGHEKKKKEKKKKEGHEKKDHGDSSSDSDSD